MAYALCVFAWLAVRPTVAPESTGRSDATECFGGLDTRENLARFAAGALLPLLLGAAFNVLPSLGVDATFALAVGLGASAWSAWVGTRTFLGLERSARIRAARIPAAACVGPIAFAALVQQTRFAAPVRRTLPT